MAPRSWYEKNRMLRTTNHTAAITALTMLRVSSTPPIPLYRSETQVEIVDVVRHPPSASADVLRASSTLRGPA